MLNVGFVGLFACLHRVLRGGLLFLRLILCVCACSVYSQKPVEDVGSCSGFYPGSISLC